MMLQSEILPDLLTWMVYGLPILFIQLYILTG